MKQTRIISVVLLVILMLGVAALACTGELTSESVTIGNLPQYVCPSATPRVTDTPLPTSPPTYPSYFTANLTNYQVGNNINSVTIQWLAQNAGTIYLSYSGSGGTYVPEDALQYLDELKSITEGTSPLTVTPGQGR